MLKYLYPHEYIDSVFSIDFKKLHDRGYRGIIFDIDNTLVHHGECSTEQIDNLFADLQLMGFKTLLLSNNTVERVQTFIKNINTPYVALAQKPKKSGYQQSLSILKLDKSEVLYVGDQIFTDILGANRCNITCILVEFLRKEDETYFGKRRSLEKIILTRYQKNKNYIYRLGGVSK